MSCAPLILTFVFAPSIMRSCSGVVSAIYQPYLLSQAWKEKSLSPLNSSFSFLGFFLGSRSPVNPYLLLVSRIFGSLHSVDNFDPPLLLLRSSILPSLPLSKGGPLPSFDWLDAGTQEYATLRHCIAEGSLAAYRCTNFYHHNSAVSLIPSGQDTLSMCISNVRQ
jgi:hypothetical protein